MLKQQWARIAFAISAMLAVELLTACSSYPGTGAYGQNGERSEPQVTCDDMFASVIHRERTDDTAGAINSELDWLGSNCSSEYDVFVDYVSAKGMAEQFGPDPCSSLSQYIGAEAIALLSRDGLCTGTASQLVADAPVEQAQPGGGIAWDDAFNYAGSTQRVCGPLAGTGNPGNDVFLNLGRDYPDPERFQIIIWDIGGVEPVPTGVTVCVSGRVSLYEGVAQIELQSSDLGLVEIYE